MSLAQRHFLVNCGPQPPPCPKGMLPMLQERRYLKTTAQNRMELYYRPGDMCHEGLSCHDNLTPKTAITADCQDVSSSYYYSVCD